MKSHIALLLWEAMESREGHRHVHCGFFAVAARESLRLNSLRSRSSLIYCSTLMPRHDRYLPGLYCWSATGQRALWGNKENLLERACFLQQQQQQQKPFPWWPLNPLVLESVDSLMRPLHSEYPDPQTFHNTRIPGDSPWQLYGPHCKENNIWTN